MGKGGGSPRQQVTDYYMSIHFGIASEVDAITGIYVNEKTAWEGDVSTQGDIQISKPDLFGGNLKEGGLVGTATFLPGRSSQVFPEGLSAKFQLTSATMPAYRGVSTVFFHGGTPFYFSDPEGWGGVFGQSIFGSGFGGGGGFLWTSNNPVVAQSVWTRVRRAPKGLNPAYAMLDGDANPIHMIYEALTNTDWGMGAPAASIDVDNFEEVAQVIYNEGLMLSMIWTRQTPVESFVTEVLDHIEATLFVHPRTGLQTIKLIRNDYNPATLRVVNPDNAELQDYQSKFPAEVINEIIVTWTNPANEQEETVTVQNISSIERQGGQIVSDNRNYYGVRKAELAQTLALRDLRAASAPLSTAKVRLLREFWDVIPGDVVRLVWPGEAGEPDIDVIMRVGPVDYGKAGSPYIDVTLVQDVFSLTLPPGLLPPSTAWQDPSQAPQSITVAQVFTLPYYLATTTSFVATARDPIFPEVLAGILAAQPNPDTRSYELLVETPEVGGATSFINTGTRNVIGRGTLTTGLALEASTTLPVGGLTGTTGSPLPNGLLIIGGTESSQEIALVNSISETSYTVTRGVLDTIPRAWPAGTPVWFLNQGLRFADEQTFRSAGETVTYKLLPTTSRGTLGDAPELTGTLTSRPYRPLRPANVRVNGALFGDVAIGAATQINIQWATRNRLFEEGVILGYTEAAVTPEYRQRTIVRVYNDATNALLVTYNHLWTENALVLQKSWFDRFGAIRIEVLSERDGIESFQFVSRRVTGLANNPAAPLPPAPPPAGEPTSTVGAPGGGAWSLSGVSLSTPTETVPALVVTGVSDNPEATEIVFEYRVSGGSGEWIAAGTEPPNTTRKEIVSVTSGTAYEVSVRYLVGGVLSSRRVLGPATAGGRVVDWSDIDGDGRPEDGATVGDNLCPNALMLNGADGFNLSGFWTWVPAPAGWPVPFVLQNAVNTMPALSELQTPLAVVIGGSRIWGSITVSRTAALSDLQFRLVEYELDGSGNPVGIGAVAGSNLTVVPTTTGNRVRYDITGTLTPFTRRVGITIDNLAGAGGIGTVSIGGFRIAYAQAGADVTALAAPRLEVPGSQNFLASFDGIISAGQQPRQLQIRRFKGDTDVSSSTTWAATGTACTATITSAGVLTINNVTASGGVEITATRDGVTLTGFIETHVVRAAPPSGSGSPRQEGNISFSSDSDIFVTARTVTVRTSSTGTIATISSTIFTFGDAGFANTQVVWQREITPGNWEDVGDVVVPDFFDFWGTAYGQAEISRTVSGLFPNNDYTFRLRVRRTTGPVANQNYSGPFVVQAL